MFNKLIEWFVSLGKGRKRPESTQWVTVAISFVLAVTLWVLVTLNSTVYTTYIPYPVKLNNLPRGLQLTQEFPQELQVLTEGNGFKILGQLLDSSRDTIEVDFLRNARKKHVLATKLLPSIDLILPSGLKAVDAIPDSISLDFVEKVSKRVPVVLHAEILLPKSYRLADPIRPKPDSVLVLGPKELLDQVTHWNTVFYTSERISEPTNLYIPLDTLAPLTVVQKEVKVEVNPRPYTEGKVKVPIYKVNMPKGVEVRLQPDSIEVSYLVPVEEFAALKPRDFRMDVDYEKINSRSKYVIPNFQALPGNVEIAGLSPQRVSYLIIREKL